MGKYPPESVIRFMAINFYKSKNRKDIKVLEVGSGGGANLWFCAREGFSVYGIDGSDTAVDRMIRRFDNEDLSDNLIGTSVGDYYHKLDDLENGAFDAVLDVESLYCNSFEKSKNIVKKCFDKLKPGGLMLSITFADGTYGIEGDEIDYHAVIPIKGNMANKGFTRYTTEDDIEKIYKLDNNKIISIERKDLHLNNGAMLKEWMIELKKDQR